MFGPLATWDLRVDVDAGAITVAYDPARVTPDDLCAALDGSGIACTQIGEARRLRSAP